MVISVRNRDSVPGLASIVRTEKTDIGCIDFVWDLSGPKKSDRNTRLADVTSVRHSSFSRSYPRRPTEKTPPSSGFYQGPDSIRISGRNRQTDIPNNSLRKPRILGQFGPCVPAICRLEDPASWSAALQIPGLPVCSPRNPRIECWNLWDRKPVRSLRLSDPERESFSQVFPPSLER